MSRALALALQSLGRASPESRSNEIPPGLRLEAADCAPQRRVDAGGSWVDVHAKKYHP